jgi:hypothetical protein
MKSRHIAALSTTSIFLSALLTSATATAEDEADRTRFRGAVSLEGGPIFVPSVVTIGSVTVEGQLGAQIDRNWGVFGVISLGAIVGQVGGPVVGAGALFDYTMGDVISVGAGVEADAMAAVSTGGCNSDTATDCSSGSAAGGALYGGRFHFAVHPVVGGKGTRRRQALSLAVDLRLMSGPFGSATVNTSGTGQSSGNLNSFMVWPTVSIGYTAF